MGILTQGINAVRDLHYTAMDTGIVGSGNTVFLPSQTDLVSPISATEATLVKTQSAQSNTTELTVDGSTAVGETIREYATYNAANLAYNRYVFTGIDHTSADELVVKNTWYYQEL